MNEYKDKVSFTILIERKLTVGATTLVDSNGQQVMLPAPIFLITDYDSAYSNTMASLLPRGITLKSLVQTSNKQGLIFTFQNDADSIEETITITLDGRDYVGTLNWTRSARFKFINPKVRIDDAASNDQFNQFYYSLHRSGMTMVKSDFFKPRDFEPDTLPNSTIRDIDMQIPIDTERGLCPMVIPYANGAVANGVSWTTGITGFVVDIVNSASSQSEKRA
jgi:hypothetical protein